MAFDQDGLDRELAEIAHEVAEPQDDVARQLAELERELEEQDPVNIQRRLGRELQQLRVDIPIIVRLLEGLRRAQLDSLAEIHNLQRQRRQLQNKEAIDRQIAILQQNRHNRDTRIQIAQHQFDQKRARIEEISLLVQPRVQHEEAPPSFLSRVKHTLTELGQAALEFTDRMTFPEDYDDNKWPMGKKYKSRRRRACNKTSLKRK